MPSPVSLSLKIRCSLNVFFATPSFKNAKASPMEHFRIRHTRSITLPPTPSPWSYHRFLVLETLKEAWVSDLKGLRNQASFSAVFLGKCPNFSSVFSTEKLRAVSQFIFSFISQCVFGCIFVFLMISSVKPYKHYACSVINVSSFHHSRFFIALSCHHYIF